MRKNVIKSVRKISVLCIILFLIFSTNAGMITADVEDVVNSTDDVGVIPSNVVEVDSFDVLNIVISGLAEGDSIQIVLTAGFEMSNQIVILADREVTITSQSEPLTLQLLDTADFRHFSVAGTLTLENVTLEGLGSNDGNDNYNGGIVVSSGGVLYLNQGSTITNNFAENGGGVFLSGTGATLTMNGGWIHSNTADYNGGGVFLSGRMEFVEENNGYRNTFSLSGNAVISGNSATRHGGGVYLDQNNFFEMKDNSVISGNSANGNGGGVFLDSGNFFKMTGGLIGDESDGRISNHALYSGGGVFLSVDNVFEMSGGMIVKNSAISGGGVALSGRDRDADMAMMPLSEVGDEGSDIANTFTLSGDGVIRNNNAESIGGGVYLGNNNNFQMEGGEISGNNAVDGGGVFLVYSNFFEMSGGMIKNNTAESNGGGLNFTGSENDFILMGDGVISNNSAELGGGVYLGKQEVLQLAEGVNAYMVIRENAGNTFTMTGGEISSNIAISDGGGVYIMQSNNFTMIADELAEGRGTISANSAFRGGGIFVIVMVAEDSQTRPRSLADDESYEWGVNILAGTISNNIADSGGGLYFGDWEEDPPPNIVIGSEVVFAGNIAAAGMMIDDAHAEANPQIKPGTLSVPGWVVLNDENVFDLITNTHAFTNYDINSRRSIRFYEVSHEPNPTDGGTTIATLFVVDHEEIEGIPVPSGTFVPENVRIEDESEIEDDSIIEDESLTQVVFTMIPAQNFTFGSWQYQTSLDLVVRNQENVWERVARVTQSDDGGEAIEQLISDDGYIHAFANFNRIPTGRDEGADTPPPHPPPQEPQPVDQPESPEEFIIHYAYLIGFPDGTIRPNTNMSRAEVATIFFRLMENEHRAYVWSQENPFSDVTIDNWFNNAVSTMANDRMLRGFPDGTFRPMVNITRAEFATIAARFMDRNYSGENLFTDIDGHWATDAINIVASQDWVRGYPDGSFRPEQPITRAEVAAIVNRIFVRHPETVADLLDGMIVWSDNVNEGAWYFLYIQEATNTNTFEMKADGIHKTWTALSVMRDWTVLERPDSRPQDIMR